MAIIIVASEDFVALSGVSAAIEALGHEAVEVESAADVVNEVISQEADMAILDENLSTFNGFELCEMLRADPDVSAEFPVLLMASADVDVRRLENVGVTDCLSKDESSVGLEDLLIKHLGDKAGATSALRPQGF